MAKLHLVFASLIAVVLLFASPPDAVAQCLICAAGPGGTPGCIGNTEGGYGCEWSAHLCWEVGDCPDGEGGGGGPVEPEGATLIDSDNNPSASALAVLDGLGTQNADLAFQEHTDDPGQVDVVVRRDCRGFITVRHFSERALEARQREIENIVLIAEE